MMPSVLCEADLQRTLKSEIRNSELLDWGFENALHLYSSLCILTLHSFQSIFLFDYHPLFDYSNYILPYKQQITAQIMPLATYQISSDSPVITATALTPESFKDFGYVISPEHLKNQADSASANQGTAVKFIQVSKSESQYAKPGLPSGKVPSFTNWNLFRCTPPSHLITEGPGTSTYLSKVLEQHPYSTQTFLPLGANSDKVSYMVIVAKTNVQGLPDVNTIQAFLAKGNQAVTYGVATWHAPMVALSQTLDFAVLINENGEADEDCREVYLNPGVGIEFDSVSKESGAAARL